MNGKNILIIGAGGQIGTVLYDKLTERYGSDKVYATDIKAQPERNIIELDVLDAEGLDKMIETNKIQVIFHLA
ncbi:MAG: NAD-dependent epimerase/dehydratase family protein, partial [Chitinophagales bacterium]